MTDKEIQDLIVECRAALLVKQISPALFERLLSGFEKLAETASEDSYAHHSAVMRERNTRPMQ